MEPQDCQCTAGPSYGGPEAGRPGVRQIDRSGGMHAAPSDTEGSGAIRVRPLAVRRMRCMPLPRHCLLRGAGAYGPCHSAAQGAVDDP